MFKQKLEELSMMALELAGEPHDYADKDLVDATLVFIEVLFNKVYSYNKSKMSFGELEKLAEDIGKTIYGKTKEWTGVDLHKAVKE